jgi:hypothetical protein
MADRNGPSKLSRWIDHAARVIFLTEDGRPKSTVLLYSFLLALLFLVVSFGIYVLMIDVLENAFSAASPGVRNAIETIVPGVIAGLVCPLLILVIREKKKLVVNAYVWLAVMFAMMAVLAVFYCDMSAGFREWLFSYGAFMRIWGWPNVVTILTGGWVSWFLYKSRSGVRKEDAERLHGRSR